MRYTFPKYMSYITGFCVHAWSRRSFSERVNLLLWNRYHYAVRYLLALHLFKNHMCRLKFKTKLSGYETSILQAVRWDLSFWGVQWSSFRPSRDWCVRRTFRWFVKVASKAADLNWTCQIRCCLKGRTQLRDMRLGRKIVKINIQALPMQKYSTTKPWIP